MKEAMLYDQRPDGTAACRVCGHRCVIAEGRRGLCRVRENRGGRLYALNNGKTAAVGVDPVEKKPLYHFLPGTLTYSFAAQGCNLRCGWCQNWRLSQSPGPSGPVAGEEISPRAHAQAAQRAGCPSVSYTYGEPTVFVEYALETMREAKKRGLFNIWVSNGFMSSETLDAILPSLDAANIDLKGTEEVYRKDCGGDAGTVRENLVRLVREGVHVEVTTLIVPGLNDRREQLEQIAGFIADELGPLVPWHISRFFPAYRKTDTPPTPLEVLETALACARKAGLSRVYPGNV